MAIAGFERDKTYHYIPEYAGNRDSESPCVIGLRFVSHARMNDYSAMIASKTKGVRDSGELQKIGEEVQRRQFIDNVVTVEGYLLGDKEVKDATTLYETADKDLVYEIIKAMESGTKLSAGLKKD